MTPAFDEGQVTAWLRNLYGETEGFLNIVSTGNWTGRFFNDIDQAVSYIRQLELRQPQGIYARATTLKSIPEEHHRGGIDHTSEFIGFWADLDITGPGHKTKLVLPSSIDECMAIVEVSGLPAPTEWVHSGGGMYPWWLLDQPQKLDPFGHHVQEYIELSANWQRVIELASEKLGYSYGAGVGDLSRVLRIPGTINRKVADAPTMCDWRVDLSTSQPYTFARLADACSAALRRLEKPKPVVTPGFSAPAASIPGNRPGDAFNAATSWPQMLEADGAQVFRDRGIGYVEWTRPGKDRRDGMSATTGYMGSDVLKVFTDSWPALRQGETYDRFGYYAATQHNGDIRQATKSLAALGYGEKRIAEGWVAPSNWEFGSAAREAASERTEAGIEDDELVTDVKAAFGAGTRGITAKPVPKQTFSYTESGMADRMQARHGNDWRYIASRQRFGWLRWNGKIWETDKKGAVTDLVDRLAQEEYAKAADLELEDEKAADKLRAAIKPLLSNNKQLGTTALFARRPQISTAADELDAQKLKLTCENGVLDLATMTFGDHDRSLLATKKLGVAFDPAATAPKWEKFLADVLPDASMREYLQRAIGYTLLGDPVRKAIFMLHGPSHTGKSQVINALTALFGDFAEGAKEQTFRVNDSANGPTPGLHKLRGARLVTASESTEGVKLDEALIKQLTGGDDICSRPLYGDEETWQPEFSIWLATNHLPKFNSDDNAIWRRVKPIHFGIEFGKEGREEVMDIGRRLVAEEGPGILNWILNGILAYRDRGLEEPEALRAGVTAYQAESDPVARFIDQAIDDMVLLADADSKVEARQLYAWFAAWCLDEGIRYPLNSNRFGRRMSVLGYERVRDSTGSKRMWQGLRANGDIWLGSGTRLHT
jgi:putative DNA primase/helicase